MKVLVLGAGGMLGNAALSFFSKSPDFQVFGSLRTEANLKFFPLSLHKLITTGINIEDDICLSRLMEKVCPDVVINGVGIVKQLAASEDPLAAITINALLPHRLARICATAGARLVHMSTDCIFSGSRGMYTEADPSDATDLYGRSKFLGEVDYQNSITLRTSIIGHELNSANSLIGWFLAQKGPVKGYARAIFSGLPTIEIARIVRDYVIPHTELRGVYHVSASPISKYDLLMMTADIYGKHNPIFFDNNFVIDRSLNSSKFKLATQYIAPEWTDLIKTMYLNRPLI